MECMTERSLQRPLSQQIFTAASQVMPGGVNSPVRAFSGLQMAPLIVQRGHGAVITDVDGNDYIDFCCSWGALILGHNHPAVMKAVYDQLFLGTSFGISTAIEKEHASLIVRLYPSIEKVRFVSSGTESTMSAIRLARGVTGKRKIVKFAGNYHGHSDNLLIKAGSGVARLPESSSAGVLKEFLQHTVCLPYNDTETVKQFLRANSDIAAVIIEPVAGNMGVVAATPDFLYMLKEETSKSGALLIFDEVITGFRIGLQGVQGLYGIIPDLTCLGKIVGGGFPAAAFGGRASIMDGLAPLGNVYQAGTLSGFPVAMAAGKATVEQLMLPQFYEELEVKTARFADPIEAYLKDRDLPICLQRAGSMMTLFFGVKRVETAQDLASLDADRFRTFFKFLFDRGIYIPPASQEAWFISAAHSEEQLDRAAHVIIEFLET